ncbi:hypothetical protein P7C73_g806, partial [Tremellales sp. Uapishka_1]
MVQIEDVSDDDSPSSHRTARRSSAPFVTPAALQDQGGVDVDFWDEFFDSLILTVPFTMLFLLLDILTNLQYARHPSIYDYLGHLMTAGPTLGMIVFYTNRHSEHFLTRSLLMSAGIFSGARLIWLVNKAPFMTTINQAPAVGTLWILTIVQLPLSRAVMSLVVVGIWSWYTGMKFKA